MKPLAQPEFLLWAERTGFRLDERYPQSVVLAFQPDPQLNRFWEVPQEPERRPHFIESLLELMGEWRSCYVWRHLGSWPQSVDASRINDVVEHRILKGLGLPLGTASIVEIPREESDVLVTLIFTTTMFGWSVGEDVSVIPSHGRYLLQTDHHDVVHVCFRALDDLERWVKVMETRGFPLADDFSDATLRQPSWMRDTDN